MRRGPLSECTGRMRLSRQAASARNRLAHPRCDVLYSAHEEIQHDGYLVSFCFNKNKRPGLREVAVGGRTIVEAVV